MSTETTYDSTQVQPSELTEIEPQVPSQPKKMLSPTAYSEEIMPSLRLARASRWAKRIAVFLLVALAVGFVLVTLAPWQQSVKGMGDVIAYAPLERQQVLESPIKGRILRLGDGIYENAFVKEGDLVAEIADIDPSYMIRLELQLEATKRQVEASKSLVEANRRNLESAKTVVESVEAQLLAYQEVKIQIIAAADADVRSAENKIEAEEEKLVEFQAALAQVQADLDRQETLFREQIVSELKYQEAQRKVGEYLAKVAGAEAYVRAANNDLESKQSQRLAKEQKAQVDIDYAAASLSKADADVAKAHSDLAKAQSEFNKAEKDLLDTESKVARQKNQEVFAPFDGFITQINANQGTQILKQGDPICTIVPQTSDRAVRLWVDGNDVPLIEPGRHVRLQFEGWPAVQFAGWPSVAVGTFGGEVVSVDATDDGTGKFRILVRPDPTDRPWPQERYLRQGVRANGWVLLERVPLWYEMWRNMNGFPPVVSTESKSKDQNKPPKLPKP